MDNNKIWESYNAAFKAEFTTLTYNTFFKNLSLHKIDEETGVVYLAADDNIALIMIKKDYIPNIQKITDKILGQTKSGSNYRIVIKETKDYAENTAPAKKKNTFSQEKLFNPKYNFDNFIVGNCNKYAHAAAVAVAESPGEVFNPLFIYGGSGLGKTHLMQAIGVHIGRKNPSAKVLYVSSEMFTDEFIKATKEGNFKAFDNKYRKLDVLLIDDIQFLEGKDGTQENFFYTFEALYNNNKQIVITADCPPVELKGIEERLRSRFSWNMIADIAPPDYETRVAILVNLAEKSNIEVTDEIYAICGMIAEQVKDNIRELEGSFNRVVGFANLLGEELTVDYAKYVLRDVIKDNSKAVEPERIKQTVASYFKLKVADLDSKKRNAEINLPRQIAMYLCRELTTLSYPEIGKFFGGRDHTTVMHSYEKISSEFKTSDSLKGIIDDLKKDILG